MFQGIRRVIEALEDIVDLFRVFVEEYTQRKIDVDDCETVGIEPGLYHITEEKLEEYLDERNKVYWLEHDDPREHVRGLDTPSEDE